MSLTLPTTANPTVLITSPGSRIAETVHALTDQGAVVTVAAADITDAATRAALDDLSGRRLVSVDAHPAPGDFDLVLRDPGTRSTAELMPPQTAGTGRVTLVGGGPGSVDLLTVGGLHAVREADVLVCDRLAPLSVLAEARSDVEVIHVGKIPRGAFTPQESINALLVEHALAGKYVVRLKGGDSYVFGRGGEEWNACVANGIPVDVVPGVSSAVAVPALAGIPLTHRGLTQGFVVVSGHVGPKDERNDADWAALAQCGLTIVILMGVAALAEISQTLIEHGMDPSTPAACIADGAMPSQRSARGTLADIASVADAEDLTPPAITVIGRVVTALEG
ncbi:uroporphyrinogen III methyltransferase [Janibacter sp. HTCC2649]|uniref:uroporphyrinogen-III C-methyltransferase n=1 Tax=Janibacter sp. HTCC2649 TaxID=313589 RepID=UPI000066EFCD|nr:uroporphyrinogen-III C-methyltransferase [Janibacter sp. HTCC2649]EAP96955.1 uroporphyrinogen III methyltransferase [Janibacter sp. HTCC2649]